METFVLILVDTFLIYLLLGVVFWLVFVWKHLDKLDVSVKGSGLWFKLLLLPGMSLFWVAFLVKWIKKEKT